jgi:hypothetical protein
MAHPDSESDGPNPSKSFSVGAADRLSGFFTPVWESKRRRTEGERGPSSRPPSRPSEPAPAHAPMTREASDADSNNGPARMSKSQPPSPRIPLPAERRPSAPPPAPARAEAQGKQALETPESAELPPEAFIDAEPVLHASEPEPTRGKAPARPKARGRKQEPAPSKAKGSAKAADVPRPAAVSTTPATLEQQGERPPLARRSSNPPPPAYEAARRPSSTPPAPARGAELTEAARAAKPAVPRPAGALPAERPLERKLGPAVNKVVIAAGAETSAREETLPMGGEQAEPPPAAAVEPAATDAARERPVETMVGTPALTANEPGTRDSASPPAPAQRGIGHGAASYADDSRALMTSGPLGAREVVSSDWDSPDTMPKPFASANASEGPTPEMRVAHLLRRLRRTIPLYAPLPDSIRKMIESDQSQQ